MENNSAIIYARVSSSGYLVNRQDTSRQVADLQTYADFAQLKVIKVFEEHISGVKKKDERPVLIEAMNFCKQNNIGMVLVSELSRLGRNAFETLSVVKELKDNGINLYLQKEQFSLFDKDGKPSIFSAIMIATLSTCAEMERQNIAYRLNSGRAQYVKNGGKLGRPVGSGKDRGQLAEEYKHVIKELKRGTSVRRTAKLCDVSTYTIQKIKNEFGL